MVRFENMNGARLAALAAALVSAVLGADRILAHYRAR
jgi:hypothetical protein